MKTVLRTVLSFPLAPFDADARDYITRVERADGQALETGVRQAIDAFVRGCKADGIWDAIKASCILAGARTLSGALVPLKGTAPTNFNFVSGDYNRKTGLVGNGSTKYLNSNRAGNADPQDNQHVAVYSSATGTGFRYVSSAFGVSGGSRLHPSFSNSRNATADTIGYAGSFPTFCGLSRSASASYGFRVGGTTSTVTRASQASAAASYFVFANNNGSAADLFDNPRLSFYSIGESIDLALLDARVTTLINSIASAIDGVTDTDARAYINAVENADGQALEVGVAQAYNAFITGCKADGIWNAIKASCILAGARTLTGALVPLKGTAPTNFNFVSGDYNRKTGLVGNGSTKYLDSNRANNADPQDSNHNSVYVTTIATNTFIGAEGSTILGTNWLATPAFCRNRTAASATAVTFSAAGLVGTSRSSSASFSIRSGGVTTDSGANASSIPESSTVLVYRRGNATPFFGNHRLSFYSIGESLDLALLDARVTTLVNTLNSVIP